MCNACFGDNKVHTLTTFTVEYNGCIIVVRNVPCLECQVCGEVTFSDEVSERLEEIVSAAKNVFQEISIIDYSKAA